VRASSLQAKLSHAQAVSRTPFLPSRRFLPCIHPLTLVLLQELPEGSPLRLRPTFGDGDINEILTNLLLFQNLGQEDVSFFLGQGLKSRQENRRGRTFCFQGLPPVLSCQSILITARRWSFPVASPSPWNGAVLVQGSLAHHIRSASHQIFRVWLSAASSRSSITRNGKQVDRLFRGNQSWEPPMMATGNDTSVGGILDRGQSGRNPSQRGGPAGWSSQDVQSAHCEENTPLIVKSIKGTVLFLAYLRTKSGTNRTVPISLLKPVISGCPALWGRAEMTFQDVNPLLPAAASFREILVLRLSMISRQSFPAAVNSSC